MHMFGLYSFKPLAVARVSGMRFLHIRRRDADPADAVAYLRHASAMSAAIAKNLSGVMSQPSELVHASGTRSEAAAAAAFMETHSQYSFIAVVSLMSLFLVITISATGLLLAFCRKKNAVFTASVKEDADSQFELDDIDNSDTEICRGDKGECYIHLSDDYDEDSDDTEEDYDPEPRRKTQKEKRTRLSKRSTTFPQIKSMLASCKGDVGKTEPDGKTSTVTTPLIQNSQTVNGSMRSGSALSPAESHVTTVRCPTLQHQNPHSSNARFRQNARALVCRNPDHQHFQKQHHNCVYSRPHYHHKRNMNYRGGVRPLVARLYRHQLPCGGGKLQRSHTIHDIPQTGCESKSTCSRELGKCGVKIKVQNMEQIVANNNNEEDSGTLPLHYISTISSSVGQFNSSEADEMEDIFKEDDTTFSNLKLRLEELHTSEAAAYHDLQPDAYQVQVVGGRIINATHAAFPANPVLQHNDGAREGLLNSDQITALNRNSPSINETIDSANCDNHEKTPQLCRHFLKQTLRHESTGEKTTPALKQVLSNLASTADSPICKLKVNQFSVSPNIDQVSMTGGDTTFQETYSLHGGDVSDISTSWSRPQQKNALTQSTPAPIPPPPSQRSKRPQSQVNAPGAAKTPRTAAAALMERPLQQRRINPVRTFLAEEALAQQIARTSQQSNTSPSTLPPSMSRCGSLTRSEEASYNVLLNDPNLKGAISKDDTFRTNMASSALAERYGDQNGEVDDDNADEVRVCLLQDMVSNDNITLGDEDDQTNSLLK